MLRMLKNEYPLCRAYVEWPSFMLNAEWNAFNAEPTSRYSYVYNVHCLKDWFGYKAISLLHIYLMYSNMRPFKMMLVCSE